MVTAASAGAEASNASRQSIQTRSTTTARSIGWLYIKPLPWRPLEPKARASPGQTCCLPADYLSDASLRIVESPLFFTLHQSLSVGADTEAALVKIGPLRL